MELSGQLHALATLHFGKNRSTPTRAGLNGCEEEKLSYPCWDLNPVLFIVLYQDSVDKTRNSFLLDTLIEQGSNHVI
jgi:hypothetical protein